MDNTFRTFKKYPTKDLAENLAQLLVEHGIETKLTDNLANFDVTFSGSKLQDEYEVKIRQSDFKNAEIILEKSVRQEIEQVSRDHYLFQFSDEELYDILISPDEWNEFDYKLSQKILADRGKEIDSELLDSLKRQRLKVLSKPEENQKTWIITGYFLSFLGGFLGMIIGYVLWTSRKTLPNGARVFSYKESDRKHGKIIFVMGVVVFPIVLIYRVLTQI